MIETRDLAFRFPHADRPAVRAVTFSVRANELVGIVGPNGSGKTTLLRLILGTLTPSEGEARILGRPAGAWARRDLARRVGVVPQREEPAFPMRVRDAVVLGRYAHLAPFAPLGARDHAAVDAALRRADAAHLADRWIATLSGGEWQRVRIARALAQEPDVLVLDEPTANLDVRHEMEVFELTRDLVDQHALTGLVVTHNVNLAARYVDRIVVMHEGSPAAMGAPNAVLTGSVFEQVFGWPVEVTRYASVPQFIPKRRPGRA